MINLKKKGLYEFLAEAVKPFGITDMNVIKRASKAGWRCYNNFYVMTKSGIPYSKALSYALQGKVVISNTSKEYPISVALVGHGYNIYDERVCMKILDKLEKKWMLKSAHLCNCLLSSLMKVLQA